MELSPDSALFYCTFVDEIQDEKLLAEYRRILPAEELDKLEKFHFAAHRKRYLVGRALLRTALAKYLHTDPGAITFSREPYGRPFLGANQRDEGVQFNVSYTDGLVAAVLIPAARVGVDVERITTQVDCLDIARTYFCQAEYEELEELSGHLRNIRFFEFWTQKEAFVKAQGLGLNLALNQVSFASCENRTAPAFVLRHDGCCYQFRLLAPSIAHKAAVCIVTKSGKDVRMSCRKVIPLLSEDRLLISGE